MWTASEKNSATCSNADGSSIAVGCHESSSNSGSVTLYISAYTIDQPKPTVLKVEMYSDDLEKVIREAVDKVVEA